MCSEKFSYVVVSPKTTAFCEHLEPVSTQFPQEAGAVICFRAVLHDILFNMFLNSRQIFTNFVSPANHLQSESSESLIFNIGYIVHVLI